ncbi:MAG: hypothetical protein WA964_01200 [Ilumatobacter sp.]|uniref:hypothetical protein n=1 Tax=Ilumatobacter sp. TaxID=1967498 RepID=UPI003C7546A4
MIDLDEHSETSTDAPARDEVVPFVLGGPLRFTGRGAVAVALLLAFAMLPVRGLFRSPGSSMEEGFMLVFPRLVQDGKVPNVDFLHLYGPGSLDVLALWYRVFGYTLEAERAFGLLQNLGIIVALYVLARPWGRSAAVLSGVVASLLTMTPIGLAALAWHGAVALALWSGVFAIRARHTESGRTWLVAGVLAGVALSFRPDIVIAVSLMLLAAGWAVRRDAWRPVVAGGAVGLLPMWIHLVVAGPGAVIQGIITDPVVELRPGRELPSPPSFGQLDGALQAIAESVPPTWPVPAPAARHQLFFWFFAVIVIAIAVPAIAWLLRRRHGANPQIDALLVAGVFGLGILPQALQRPDSTHLAWVAMVSWPLLAALITHVVSRRVPRIGRASVLSGGVVVLALMLVVSPFYTYRYYLLHTRVAVGDLPLPFLVEREDRKFWFGNPEVANALIAMIPDLDARSEPGDRLVVGTADLSRTVYSDVSIYFLFDELEPATYFIEMDPGLADAAGSGLAEDIEQADFVVLTNFWSGWLEPNTSVKRQSQEHNQAVADNFCLVGQYESNLLMLFERCEGGGGISGADVDGLYPVVPVPEELAD